MNIPKNSRPFVGSLLLLLFANSLQAAVNWLSPELEALQRQAQQEDKLFLLYFSADWCAPCKWMEENTFQDAQLGGFLQSNYLAAKVDLNNTNNKVLQHQFEVEVIPSILVFATNGQLIARRTASQEAKPLLRWLRHLDQPAHHVDAALPQMAAEKAIASPKKSRSFRRPALITDNEPGLLTSSTPRPSTSTVTSPTLILSGDPLAVSEAKFTPRSGAEYGIRLQQTLSDYSSAVQEVTELERKFEARAELQPMPNGQYEVVLGQFETTGEARRFLQYLQRNDRQGEIVTLSDN